MLYPIDGAYWSPNYGNRWLVHVIYEYDRGARDGTNYETRVLWGIYNRNQYIIDTGASYSFFGSAPLCIQIL